MKPLLDFAHHHPGASAVLGTISGLTATLLQYLDVASSIAGKLGIIAACASSILWVMLLLSKWRHRHDWVKRVHAQVDARRRLQLDDDPLDS